MLIEMDEKDILEHFGTRGMKWGVRKAKTSDDGSDDGSSETKPDNSARNKKIAASIGLGIAVVAVGLLADKHFRTSGGAAARQVGQLAAKAKLQREGMAKVSHIAKTAPPVMSASHQLFMKRFTERQNKINAQANDDLRRGYERGMVPFPQREFLPSWS